MKKLLLTLIIHGVFFIPRLIAQPGTLDPEFGTDGKVITPISSIKEEAFAVAIQSDGKILVLGHTKIGGLDDYDIALARYDIRGVLDNSFGTNGIATTRLGPHTDTGFDLAIQPDGKIVVAGCAQKNDTIYTAVLLRYLDDGSPDPGFGNNRIITELFGSESQFYSTAVQDDGKIIAAGYLFNTDHHELLVVRYNSDGTPDKTFGNEGVVMTEFEYAAIGKEIVIFPDHTFVVGGRVASGSWGFGLVKYDTVGNVIKEFANYCYLTDTGCIPGVGTIIEFNTGFLYFEDMALAPDNSIIVVGSYEGLETYSRDLIVMRCKPEGDEDNHFGNHRAVMINYGKSTEARAVGVLRNGQIVVAGCVTDDNKHTSIVVTRYNSAGIPDSTFGDNGKVFSDLGEGKSEANALAIDDKGNVVVAGRYIRSDSLGYIREHGFALARYLQYIDVGEINFSENSNALLVYPNPVDDQVILNFSLDMRDVISIYLTDIQGRKIMDILQKSEFTPGNHQQEILLPDLATGNYFIVLSGTRGKFCVEICK